MLLIHDRLTWTFFTVHHFTSLSLSFYIHTHIWHIHNTTNANNPLFISHWRHHCQPLASLHFAFAELLPIACATPRLLHHLHRLLGIRIRQTPSQTLSKLRPSLRQPKSGPATRTNCVARVDKLDILLVIRVPGALCLFFLTLKAALRPKSLFLGNAQDADRDSDSAPIAPQLQHHHFFVFSPRHSIKDVHHRKCHPGSPAAGRT